MSRSGSQGGVRIVEPNPCGRYTIIASIGHGGMGGVYLGVGTGASGFRKIVVIKKIHAHLAEDSRFVTMFMDEARLAARMNHPNLVQTFEVGRDRQKIPFMAMEYMEGQSFSDLIRASLREHQKPLSKDIVVNVIIHSLMGLHHAHQLLDYDDSPLNVVHRDISPSNLFVTKEGVSKVLDFGIAKAADSETTTKVGEIKGKYAYMSPEQATGLEIDRRADIWAMGVTLFSALTGKHAFRAKSDVETIDRVLNYPIEKRLDEVRDIVDDDMRAIIAKCLEREIDGRYATADELRIDLENYARAQQISLSSAPLATFISDHFGEQMEMRRKTVSTIVDDFEETTRLGDRDGQTAWTEVDAPKFEEPSAPDRKALPLWLMLSLFSVVLLGGVYGILKLVIPPQQPQQVNQAPQVIREIVKEPAPVPVAPKPAKQEEESVEAGNGNEAEVESRKISVKPSTRRPIRRKPRDTKASAGGGADTSKEEPAKEQVVEPAKPDGLLTLLPHPWADVYEGGKKLGTTPWIRKKFPSGTHRLTLKTADGREHVIEVTVNPNKLTTKKPGL